MGEERAPPGLQVLMERQVAALVGLPNRPALALALTPCMLQRADTSSELGEDATHEPGNLGRWWGGVVGQRGEGWRGACARG